MGFFPMVNWTNPLRFLDVSHTLFSGELPKSIGNLKFLRYLGLSGCNFSKSLPATLGNLTQLTFFDLSYNSFSGEIPSSVSNIKALNFFDLQSNNLNGSIPASIGNVTKVTQFFLQSNNLIGQIPSSLSNLKDLTLIDLSNNNFEDQLPWKNLWNLDLSANLLQGKLPVPPSCIEFFLISNNSLIGGIPSMICNASSLTVLDISHNSLGGTVPQCLGNFSNDLVVMDLRMNNFHGTIPDTFVKVNRLTTLVFNGNQLEGPLPKSLVNCTTLEVLDLGNNKISDFFPSWLEALPELKTVGNNKISDFFPSWLEALPELKVLVLNSNRFHGPIGNHKTSGKSFSKLQILDLSHNEFTGLLPRNYFQNLNAMMTIQGKTLQYLGGSDYYQDSVVVTMKGTKIELERILSIFTTIDLSCNKFEGEIPEVLGRLTILRLLNLSHNSLTGHIPLSLANLSALESIDLSSNKLTGEIPMQLTSLTFLAMLNLSQNQLIGPIPQGKQFDTFENDSYYGNLGLCGLPLSIKCRTDASPLPSPSIFQEDNDSMFASGFGWKAVLMGYGCGFVFGLAVGYVFWFKTEKPQWLVRFFDGGNGKTGWPNNQRPRRRRS
uniref:Disease resistance R13L4/SHOC-2-like LRR domain-containing protein n=1 Tax=Fagus sylvatica TaxID=28930 RepID=A0A2N9HN35_FAGSY